MYDFGALEAQGRVLRPTLRQFAARLQARTISDPRLAAAADAWSTAATLRYVPRPDVCSVLRAWAKTNFSAEVRPVDPELIDLEFREIRSRAIVTSQGARRLRLLGVPQQIAQRLASAELFKQLSCCL